MENMQDLMQRFAVLGKNVPKRPDRVIFLGRRSGRLLDNVKYAFLHCARNLPDLDTHFLTFNRDEYVQLQTRGLPVLHFGSGESVEFLASAGLVVCDDLLWKTDTPLYPLLLGASKLQLWHGIPLKAIGFPEIASAVNMTEEKAERLRFGYSGYDAVLSTSPFCTRHAFAKAFQADEFPELGYPRNDVLLREPTADDLLNADTALYGELRAFRKRGGKTIFYMPTFRDQAAHDPLVSGAVDLQGLAGLVHAAGALLVLKLHPYVDIRLENLPPGIRVAESQSDIYPLMSQCDLLLTDYSSIYFDFLLLDRPLLFNPYDLERYKATNRTLLFDYERMTPGAKALTGAQLRAMLLAALDGADPHAEARRALRDTVFTHCDGNSAARLGEYIRTRFVARRKAAP